MLESNILREGLDKLVSLGARMWRNNVGTALQGNERLIAPRTMSVMLNAGDGVVRRAQWVKYGLGVGSGDLIGLQSVVITPEMVGKKVAIFVSGEAKQPRGNATKEQKSWHEMVLANGGHSFVFRSADEAAAGLALLDQRLRG